MASHGKKGFTLVELLVGISIITALTAVTLPAIQAAREASRMASCRNNLAQVSKGMIQFEGYYGYFPSGGWSPQWLGVADRTGDAAQPGGWSYTVLPYVDALGTRNLVANVPSSGASAAYNKLVTTSVPGFNCPSRRSSQSLPVATADGTFQTGGVAVTVTRAVRGDYAMNSGNVESCPKLTAYMAVVNTATPSVFAVAASTPGKSGSSSGKSGSSAGSSGSGSSGSNSGKNDDSNDDKDDEDDDGEDDDDDANGIAKVTICHAPPGNPANGNTLKIAVAGLNGHANHPGDRLGSCDSCLQPVVPDTPTSLSVGDSWRGMSASDRMSKLKDRGIPDVQNGLTGRMCRLKAAHVADGLSNTYLLGEKNVATSAYHTGTDDGDSSPMMAGYSSSSARWGYTPPAMDSSVANPAAFGSAHRAGCNMAYADGTVRTLSYSIDATLHSRLSCRNDGPKVIAIPPQ